MKERCNLTFAWREYSAFCTLSWSGNPAFSTATDYFTQTLTNIAGAISISVSTAIEAFNLFRPPNVHVDVCHWVWRPMCLTPHCVSNRPVEFPATRSFLIDCTGVAQWSSALEVVRKL